MTLDILLSHTLFADIKCWKNGQCRNLDEGRSTFPHPGDQMCEREKAERNAHIQSELVFQLCEPFSRELSMMRVGSEKGFDSALIRLTRFYFAFCMAQLLSPVPIVKDVSLLIYLLFSVKLTCLGGSYERTYEERCQWMIALHSGI